MGLDTVELIMAVEEEFGISIPNEQAERLLTPRMLINAVEDLTGRPREQIAEMVRTIIIELTGIKESDYFEDADFIRDLGNGLTNKRLSAYKWISPNTPIFRSRLRPTRPACFLQS